MVDQKLRSLQTLIVALAREFQPVFAGGVGSEGLPIIELCIVRFEQFHRFEIFGFGIDTSIDVAGSPLLGFCEDVALELVILKSILQIFG